MTFFHKDLLKIKKLQLKKNKLLIKLERLSNFELLVLNKNKNDLKCILLIKVYF